MTIRVAYVEALRFHARNQGHIAATVSDWHPADLRRLKAPETVAQAIHGTTTLADDLLVVGKKLPVCGDSTRRGVYSTSDLPSSDEEAFRFWSGQMDTKPYQPVLLYSTHDELMSWIKDSCRDPIVYSNLSVKTINSAIRYAREFADEGDAKAAMLYGGALGLGEIVVFLNTASIQEVAESLFEHCSRSDNYSAYVSGPFAIPS